MSWLTFAAGCGFVGWCVEAGFSGDLRTAVTAGALALLLFDLSWRRAMR